MFYFIYFIFSRPFIEMKKSNILLSGSDDELFVQVHVQLLSTEDRRDFWLFRKKFVVQFRQKFKKMKFWTLVTLYFSRIDDELSSILQAIEINHSQAVKLCNQIQADCRKQISKGNIQTVTPSFRSRKFRIFKMNFQKTKQG